MTHTLYDGRMESNTFIEKTFNQLLTHGGLLIYGRGMITRDNWIEYIAMLTDAELSALAAVLVDEQRKRDEAAQRLADEQAAREWAAKGGKS